MIKVAHFIDSPDPGGAETLVIDICREIRARSYIPEVLHFGNPWLEEKCLEYGIESTLVPGFKQFKSAKTLPLFAISFAMFLKKRQVNILHSHLFGAITGGAFAAKIAGVPHIGTIHDTYTIEEKKSRARLLNLAARFGTRLVTVSNQMRTYLESLSKFPDNSIQVIHNGVSLKKFGSKDADFRQSIGVGKDDIIFTCVGRLVELKAHDTLIEAFAEATDDSKVKLLIVGDGPEMGNCSRLIEAKGLKNRVRLLGQRDDVPSILGISDCFVLASKSEGLSCSIIEAMASGLPVIATNVGGNPELIKDGESGYLVPVGDVAALSEAIRNLADDPMKRKSFGEASSRIAAESFSMEAMMGEYLKNYGEMAVKKCGDIHAVI